MSPVTGLARLPGRILRCVHKGNFSPVDRDEFKNTTKVVQHKFVLFATVIVDSCNFINKAISQIYSILAAML